MKGASFMEVFDELMEYELIRKIADPILDKLLEMQEEIGPEALENPMRIQIVSPQTDGHVIPSDDSLTGYMTTKDFLCKLEAYLQEQLDMWNRPTVLH